MSNIMIGVICFVFMLALIFHGFPISISMFLMSGIGFLWLRDWNIAILHTQFASTIFNNSANYEFAVLPLFILLGTLAGVTGIAEGAFDSIRAWLGKMRGGTLFTVIVANAIYGACSANSSAGNIIFSRLAMPSLRKEGYDETLSLGVLCSSGSLASLIPPSQAILTICMVAPAVMVDGKNFTMSLGTGLMCGIIPAIVLILMLYVMIRIYGVVKKGTLPPASTEKVPVKEKLKTLKLLIPILLVFFVMIGGPSLGWFSTTVGGAIGAFVVVVYAIARKVSFKQLCGCFWEACLMQAGIFIIIVAGNCFSRFIASTGLTTVLGQAVSAMNAPPLAMFGLVMVFYLIGGAVMNVVPLIICTCSIVFAVLVEGCGYHPYVVMIALVLIVEVAQLTPPIGLGTYITANALRIDPMKIFKAAVPFFIVLFLCTFVLALFPDLVLFLPKTLGLLS
ncbi:MAG: TRAP transporter large permease subunit [Ruminococcaceae bacterium]|nr:TRAP transporter large permease subunit [Oscillospiraceae bacterium]